MGLLQKAVETYDSHFAYATEKKEGQEPMAPVSHMIAKAALEITITEDGKFINATKVPKEDEKTVIPASVTSSGRTSSAQPHPLCDKLSYIAPFDEERYNMYVSELEAWANSSYTHPKVQAVLAYVRRKTIVSDLQKCKILEYDRNGKLKENDVLVRWIVFGDGIDACWKDKTLIDAYIKYDEYINQNLEKELDMITGEENAYLAVHPKSLIAHFPKAKLISSKDDGFPFKYRGRFISAREAFSMGVYTSQKAHNALRWLVDSQGVQAIFGGRTFLCWNPQGKPIDRPTNPLLRNQKPKFRPSDYHDALKAALNSKKAELELTDGVVLAAFDAATTGRLSLTYYNELQAHDFLDRLHDWDASCCWPHRNFGIQSPSLRQIVDCAFGTQRTEKGQARLDTDERVLRQQMQRLIACRVDRALIGADIVKALSDRASRPQAYDIYVWENILFTACAVIRKYRMDRFKEEWSMALEPERKDRSYQFGRLLAVMEKVERDTYDSSEGREPNAMRMQSVFCQRPMYAANNLETQLERAYFPRLKPGTRIWYKNLIGQIMEQISQFPGEENKPLEDTYLMGYYLQRSALYTKKTDNEMEENEA